MDISGAYTRVPQFSAQLPESIFKAGNRESLKSCDEQNQSQPHPASTHFAARFTIRSAKERQELLTKTNSFKYESFDKVSRSIKECTEDMSRVHSISSSSPDTNVIDKRRPTLNQLSVAKKADLSINPRASHCIQKNPENVESPTTAVRGRTQWRQVDLSNRSKSLDWRVSTFKGVQENQMDAMSNTKNHEGRSIQLGLMKKTELSTGSETSITAQKKPDIVESLTTNVKERTELKQHLSNRSKSVDWSESKFKEGQENRTNVISNAKDLKGKSVKCSESLENSDADIRPNFSELDKTLKKVSLYIQPFSGHGQRKQEFIFSPISETSPARTVALAQSFPSRIKAIHSQEGTAERKSSWYSGHSGTKLDQPEHHFRSQVTSSNVSDISRNGTVMVKNGCTVLEDSSDASSEVLHGMITPVPYVGFYPTESNNRINPKKCSTDRSISVSSSSEMNNFSYKPDKYGTFPKAPRKKEQMNVFTVPDTSFVSPSGKGYSDTMSTFFKDKPLRQDCISSLSKNSISNDRLLIRNSIGLGTNSLGRKRDRGFTAFTAFSAHGLSDNNSMQKSIKNETEMPEEKMTVNGKLTKGMGTTTISGKQPYNSQEEVIPWTKLQSYPSLSANSEKHHPERGVGLEFGSSGNPSKKNEGVLDKVQIPCLASVRNTIDKFEALAQQSQSFSGIQPPRRAFSVTEKPKVVPSLNKAYSDRSLGKRWGDWNREFLKEDLFSKSEVSNEEAAKQDPSEPVQITTQDKEGSTLKTPTSRPKSKEPGLTQALKQLEELPSKQRIEMFTMLDEPDFFKGSKSYQPPKTIELSENKFRNYLSSSSSPNPQKSSEINNVSHSEFKDSTKSAKDNAFQNKSTSLLQNLYSSSKAKTPSYLFSDSGVMPSIQGLGDLSNPYSTIKDKKGAEKVIRWIMDKGADDEMGEDGIDDEDDEGTEGSYDSDSGESSVTITSNMSARSFSMSLVELCSLGGLDLPSLDGGGSKDDEDWMSKRTVSMSSDVALSSVTLLDMDELECLLNDVRGLDDNALENYEDVHVVVLHKEAGGGLGFTVAGGVDQNKPVTVHKVLPSGIAAREGSIHEGDQVLSINGTSLHNSTHKEALYTMKKARGRAMTVVVIKRGDVTELCYNLKDSTQKPVGTSGCRIRVLLNKCSSDLGFSLEGGVGSTLGDKPLTVQRLFQGGPVGKVFPGDELLEVEGQSLEGLRRLEVWQLIKRLPPGPVEVLLQRPYKQY
ncbi:Pro-interleukin-16 [Bagarius yarrelli]|uniref:Pro-interleukin-16 n=1 Tax=Bagarius yarrelli TaxID=175774 RepID=A0A556V9W9_BAGYA|nr:Pro-interleukin-16 [Bagarius yarrelli]